MQTTIKQADVSRPEALQNKTEKTLVETTA